MRRGWQDDFIERIEGRAQPPPQADAYHWVTGTASSACVAEVVNEESYPVQDGNNDASQDCLREPEG